jgi:hypothetical protein
VRDLERKIRLSLGGRIVGAHPFLRSNNILYVVEQLYSIPRWFAVPLMVSTGISERSSL